MSQQCQYCGKNVMGPHDCTPRGNTLQSMITPKPKPMARQAAAIKLTEEQEVRAQEAYRAAHLSGSSTEGRRQSEELIALRDLCALMEKALTEVLPSIPHSTECVTVNPSELWATEGSVHYRNCKCNVALVEAALAAAQEGK